MLLRLEPHPVRTARPAAELAAGLRIHLDHTALAATLVQIGDDQRAYLTTRGCAGCLHGRCQPGCPRDLLARLLARQLPSVRIVTVTSGLARRPYSQVALAIPGRQARPIPPEALHAWEEARLTLHWRVRRRQLQVGATLAVGAAGPAPLDVLHAYGWQPTRRIFLRRPSLPPLPLATTARGQWPGDPYLLLPRPRSSGGEDSFSSTPPDEAGGGAPATAALATRLIAQLSPLIEVNLEADRTIFRLWAAPAGDESTSAVGVAGSPCVGDDIATAVVEPPDSSLWPAGPGRMRPADVGFLIEQIRTSPIVQTGDEPGVTRRRVAQLLPDDLSEYSRQLVYWLHLAGALLPPPAPDEPFRNPRRLHDLPDEALAAQLAATPVPTSEQARAAMQR
jgi:hypothetical protein